MATTYYFNEDDLTARRNKTARWIFARATQLAKELKYTGHLDDCKLANLSLIVALSKTVENYTPVVDDDDDTNCLTEAEAENVFNIISRITGLVFLPKNTVYNNSIADDNNQFRTPTLISGSTLTLVGGAEISFNILNKERLTR